MVIKRSEDVMCPRCGMVSKLGEWNDVTYGRCKNREMKRDFTQLTESKAFLRKSDTFYLCPKCKDWSRGCQLSIVNTENPALKKLGGEPIMRIINND